MMNTYSDGIMTREATARYLKVSLPTLDAYLHRAENPIPAIRAGRKYLIPFTLLEVWLKDEAERNMSLGANTIKKGGIASE